MKIILNIIQFLHIIFIYSYFIGLIIACLYVVSIIDKKYKDELLSTSEQYYFYLSICYIITFIIYTSFAYLFIITMYCIK